MTLKILAWLWFCFLERYRDIAVIEALTGDSWDQFEGSQHSHRPQGPEIHRNVHVCACCSQNPTGINTNMSVSRATQADCWTILQMHKNKKKEEFHALRRDNGTLTHVNTPRPSPHRDTESADGWSVQIGSVRTWGSPAGGEKRGNNRDALGTFGCFPPRGRTAVTTAI